MNNDTFFLITRQPVKNGMGFTISQIRQEEVKSMLRSAMLDSYITMRVAMDIVSNGNRFDNESVSILLDSVEKIEGDGIAKITKTIKFIESFLPLHTTEIEKFFKCMEDKEEFFKDFMKSYEKSKEKFVVSREYEPSSKVRPLFAGNLYYRNIIKNMNSNHILSYADKQRIKEELNKSLKYATQLSASEKFVAWASLQSKKRQEACSQEDSRTKEDESQTVQVSTA